MSEARIARRRRLRHDAVSSRHPTCSASARWASATPRRRPRSRRRCSAAAARDWAGRGTGVDEHGLARKSAVIDAGARASRRRARTIRSRVAAALGGRELAAIAGATLAARRHSIPVLLDGFVCTAAAAPLYKLRADTLAHALAGHVSAEAGHRMLLDALGLRRCSTSTCGSAKAPAPALALADPARRARLPHRHGDLRRGRRVRPAGGGGDGEGGGVVLCPSRCWQCAELARRTSEDHLADARRSAYSIASIRLRSLAMPLPAMSNAVP